MDHEYGDEVLFNIAQIMEASLTDGEIFGRYGGEEFVILFPGKTPAEALPHSACTRRSCEDTWMESW